MEFTLERQSKYMKIPFKSHGKDFSGCDCGGLVWLVYKNELGIELPDWTDLYSGTRIENSLELCETVSTMLGENGIEVPFSEIRPFDVVAFNIAGTPIHVGVVTTKRIFMHTMQGRTRVEQVRFDNPQWRNRLTGCFRHEAMLQK